MLGNDSTTNSIELNNLGRKLFGPKWGGLYASDTVPGIVRGYSIVNLSTMSSGGVLIGFLKLKMDTFTTVLNRMED